MVNKKLSKILGPVLGTMVFMSAIGILEVPVLADDNVQADSIASASVNNSEYKDYSITINKSVTQNGIKVTADKAIGTKHKLKVTLKIESEQPLEKVKHGNSIYELTYGNGNNNYMHTNYSYEYVNDKTMIVTLEKDNFQGEYPAKGEMRVDLALSKYKVNIGMDILVDFTEAFKDTIEKDVSGKIPEFDYTVNKLEADAMGTRITYSEPKTDEDRADKSDKLWHSVMILKVGDKMYTTDSHGSYMGEDGVKTGNYESKIATYYKVKDEKNISIIPMICNITWEELSKINDLDMKKEENIDKETINNVSYEKYFKFADGSKGEIYNIERNDNSIKVYCKGESEKESLLMATNIEMHYQHIEGQNNNVFYNSDDNKSFYKDPKESLGYIVEYENVEKDKGVDLILDSIIKNIDRYKLEDEIKLTK